MEQRLNEMNRYYRPKLKDEIDTIVQQAEGFTKESRPEESRMRDYREAYGLLGQIDGAYQPFSDHEPYLELNRIRGKLKELKRAMQKILAIPTSDVLKELKLIADEIKRTHDDFSLTRERYQNEMNDLRKC